jgi:hypothetical protein
VRRHRVVTVPGRHDDLAARRTFAPHHLFELCRTLGIAVFDAVAG